MNTARAINLTNENFQFEITQSDNKNHVNLIGIIDEDTDFSALLKLKDSQVIFNFKNITSINSCGIRTWVNFIKEFPEGTVEYTECPPLIVRQMNMVPSFLGKAKVNDVFVPYVCDSCDHEQSRLMSVEDFKKGISVPETIQCENCKSEEMEIDGNVKQYFAFAK